MALLHIPLSQIDEQQLHRLIEAQAVEARDIEYKRQSYGDSDADRAEWLADASSFANTNGGDLILGIHAKDGVPVALTPLSIDLDQEILRLEQIARSNLQPRISHLDFKRVPIATGGEVLIVRIQRSFNPPHRVVRNGKKGDNRFWARSSAGKYEPNVDELRAMFNLAPQLADRIRDFRAERVAKIAADAGPVKLMGSGCLVLHIIPFSSLDPGGALLRLADVEANPHPFAPISSSGAHTWWVNFDGVFLPSNADRTAPEQRAYTQLYRTGRLEMVASSLTAGDGLAGVAPKLIAHRIEGLVLLTLVRALKALQDLGVEPPFAIMISLVGVKGVHMQAALNPEWLDDDITVLTDDQYHFNEIILDSVPQSIQEAGKIMRPFVEQLANMAGRATSQSFDAQGEYLHAFG